MTTHRCLFSLVLALAGCTGSRTALPQAAEASRPARTIDERIQRIVSEELDRIAAEWRPSRAVIVVMDPRTGAVLAMDGRDGQRADASLASDRTWITGSTMKSIT